MKHDLAAIKDQLSDPHAVAALLSLTDGSRREGRNIKILCPRHGERHASCSLSIGADGTLRVNCFGCDLQGDILTLVAEVMGLDMATGFRAVVEATAALAGLGASACTPLVARPPRGPLPPPLDDAIFSAIVRDLYRPLSTAARDYLDGRRLLAEATADGWFPLPPVSEQAALIQRLRDRHGDEALLSSGLLPAPRDGQPYWGAFSLSTHLLCIPYRRRDGLTVTLQRRTVGSPGCFANGEPRPPYVFARGRQPSVPYGLPRLSGRRIPLAFVEGAPDTLALRLIAAARGAEMDVLGVPGVDGWRSSYAAFGRGRDVLIGMDNDKAGERVVARIREDVARAGGTPTRLRPSPGHKDWAEQWAPKKVAA